MRSMVHRTFVTATLVVLLMAPASVGAEEDEDLPTLALYFDNQASAAPAAGAKVMSMTAEAPTAAASAKAYLATGFFALTYETRFDYIVEEPFILVGPVTGKAFLSCDVATAWRHGLDTGGVNDRPSTTLHVTRGNTILGEHARFDPVGTCTGPSSVQELTYTISVPETQYNEGDRLSAGIFAWVANTPPGTVENAHLLIAGTQRASSISFPMIPLGAPAEAGPELVEDVVTDASVDLAFSFDEPTTAIHRYAWTTDLTAVDLTAAAEASEGSALLVVRDGAGAELYNRTVDPEAGVEEQLRLEAAAGNWTVEVAFEAFAGNLTLRIEPAPSGEPGAPGGGQAPQDNQTGPADGNATGQDAPEDAKGSIPGPGGLVALAAVLAGLAVAARHRRAPPQ